ncbi:MAG: aminotransferase class V-fold PLP-dependent enzyme [Rubripirellula sp.]
MNYRQGTTLISIKISDSPWAWWRAHMPIAPEWAYFDHAAVGPLSKPAATAIAHFAAQAAEQGDTVWPEWAAKVEHLREQFAGLLNCDNNEICLIPNTTTGINLVAEGWPWQNGDSVVLPEGEFPSNLFPWQNQQSKGVEVRIAPRQNGEVTVESLMSQVDDTTRLISLSWVGYASGFRIDLENLVNQAHHRGVMVFLDAIQGLGIYPLDLKKIPLDFLAADGHKWLLGPEGAGVAMIAKRHLNQLRCLNVGWGSVKNSFNYAHPSLDLRDSAARFESGSANMIGAAALSASLQMIIDIRNELGQHAISARICQLAATLDRKLKDAGAVTRFPNAAEHRSGIVTFEVPGLEPAAIRKEAIRQKVVLSCRDGGVRAAVHAYNDEEDVERLVDVVRSMPRQT